MFRPGPPHDERELPSRFGFADCEVDVPAARVRRAGTPLPLEPRAFDLLLLLAANPGRVVEKGEIFERLWAKEFVTDNALTRVVAHLRRELGDDAGQPAVVETVRTRGYRFLPEIVPVAAEVAATAPPPRGHRLTIGPWLVSAALALGLAGALAVLLAKRERTPTAAFQPLAPVQRTVEPGNQLQPDYSPDGSQLVYASDAAGGLEVFVRPVAGGRPLQLTGDGPNTEPAWSPDGRWIAYRNVARGGIWLVAPTGGETRQLTDFGGQPAWSPDGRTLVVSYPGRKVTLGALEWPATYDSTLWLVDVASGGARPLTTATPEIGGHGMPAFSPDGEWVVYATGNLRGNGGLWRVRAAGGEPQALVPASEQGSADERILWHDPIPRPDGSGLYALRTGRGTQLVRLGWDGTSPAVPLLAPAPEGTVHLAISRDGRQLAFSVEQAETSIEEVAVGPDGSVSAAPRTLVASTTRRMLAPRYSPDGDRLLFRRIRSGSDPELVVVDAQGRELRVVSDLPFGDWESPTEIVLAPLLDSIRLDVLTGRRTALSAPSGAEEALALAAPRPAALRGDQRALAFTRQDVATRELMVWEAGAGAAHQLTRLGGLVDYPSWSRDGRWIAFQHTPRPQDANELWRIDAAGGEPERFRSGEGASWGASFSPDGERIVYAAFREGRWHLATAGVAEPERLLDVPPETTGYLRWPDWSPDGTRIAYERRRFRTTVWTVDIEADAASP